MSLLRQDAEWRDVGEVDAVAKLEPLPSFVDPRGRLVEVYRDDEIPATMAQGRRLGRPRMGYLSVTLQGVVRGPHEHAEQTDMFVFCSSAFTVFLWDLSTRRRQKILVPADGYYRLLVPPGVVHAYRAESPQAVSLNFPDALYAGYGKTEPVDEVRHENNPESPYQLW
jgi:dTDP-4-dehydrorhamnose 3,5-epimerase